MHHISTFCLIINVEVQLKSIAGVDETTRQLVRVVMIRSGDSGKDTVILESQIELVRIEGLLLLLDGGQLPLSVEVTNIAVLLAGDRRQQAEGQNGKNSYKGLHQIGR